MARRTRFVHQWWRQFDQPTDGYMDSGGHLNRLPLRLESKEVIIFGLVDPVAMWQEFEDEAFVPVMVGDKAVVSVWFNQFQDTDCGGSYLETWYNSFVTDADKPLQLPFESPMSCLIEAEGVYSFLQRVVCGDAPGNPGAALKAIHGGREMFGFPKHPNPGAIRFWFDEEAGTAHFLASHNGRSVVKFNCKVPGMAGLEPLATVPVEMTTPMDYVIGAPRLGGTHKNMNGANQMRFGQSLCCTQHVHMWDPKTDSLELGDDEHYAQPLSRWGFEPMVKVYSPDFKIAAHKPSGWRSGAFAAKAVKFHEQQIAQGTNAGAVHSRL